MNKYNTIAFIGRVFFGVTGFFGVGLTFMAPMLFDAPGATSNPATVTLFWSILMYPVVSLLSIIVGWLLSKYSNPWLGCVVSFVPALNLLAAVIAVIGLNLFYGGSLK